MKTSSNRKTSLTSTAARFARAAISAGAVSIAPHFAHAQGSVPAAGVDTSDASQPPSIRREGVSLLTTPALNIQIYGVLSTGEARVSNVGGKHIDKIQNALDYSNYLGFKGAYRLDNGYTASFALASQVNSATGVAGQGAVFWAKNAWAGIGRDDLGAIAFGRNDEFASEQCYVSSLCQASTIYSLHPGNLDRSGTSQLGDMVKYISPLFLSSYRVRAYYSRGDATAATNIGHASGFEGTYKGTQLDVTATYEEIQGTTISPLSTSQGFGVSKFFNTAVTPASNFVMKTQNISFLGARYAIGKFLLYGSGSNVKLVYAGSPESMRTVEAGFRYSFTDPLSANAGCFRSRFQSSTWNNCGLHVTYQFDKHIGVFAADSFEHVSGTSVHAQMFQSGGASTTTSQNGVAVGIRLLL